MGVEAEQPRLRRRRGRAPRPARSGGPAAACGLRPLLAGAAADRSSPTGRLPRLFGARSVIDIKCAISRGIRDSERDLTVTGETACTPLPGREPLKPLPSSRGLKVREYVTGASLT